MNKPLPNIKKDTAVDPTTLKKRSFRKVLWKIGKYFSAVLFLIFLVFQLPPVQNWLAHKATNYLSNELNTTVSVDKVRLNIIDGFLLENFYLEDKAGDTLLMSSLLRVDLTGGIFGLIFKNVDVEELAINDANFNLKIPYNSDSNNLQFLIDYFSKPPKAKKDSSSQTKPLSLTINSLFLNNFHFIKSDSVLGQDLDIFIGNGEIQFDSVDLSKQKISVGHIDLKNPIVRIDEFFGSLPMDTFEIQRDSNYYKWLNATPNPFLATVKKFDLEGGTFYLDNYRNAPFKDSLSKKIDYQHLALFDINVHINNFSYQNWNFNGEVEKISLRDSLGFVVDTLSVKQVSINDKRVELFGFQLKTPVSNIGDTLIMKYNRFLDFQRFIEQVRVDGKFQNAQVAFMDVMSIAPNLRNNVFFRRNQNEVFDLDGRVYGKINRLNARNLKINLADQLVFEGKFNSRDLTVLDEQFMDLDIENLRTNMQTLRQIIPSFNPPKNFDKLGKVNFSGKFFGFFVDFNMDGKVGTTLGNGVVDMRMNLKGGREKAEYSGGLTLFDFDLGTWSDDRNFGNITFTSNVNEGVGLTLPTADAKLSGRIDSLEFKGYNYKNVNMSGRLKQNLFNGDLRARDRNINLNFKGEIDFTEEIPVFDFFADINHLDLLRLNLAKKDVQLSGLVDLTLQDIDPSNILGDAIIREFQLIRNRRDTINIDSVFAASTIDNNGHKSFTVTSDVIDSKINGDFDVELIPEALLQFLETNFTKFSNRFGIKSKGLELESYDFDFDFLIHDTKGLLKILDENLAGFENSTIKGAFNDNTEEMDLDINIPKFRYQNVSFENVILYSNTEKNEADINLGVNKIRFNNNFEIAPIWLMGYVNQDTLEFGINSLNLVELLDHLKLDGKLILEGEEDYQVQLFSSKLVILSDDWTINDNNYIRFNSKSVETNNLEMTNKDRRILLENLKDIGLKLSIENIDLDFINEAWLYEPLDFGGKINVYATVKNLFKLENLSLIASSDSLLINEENYGQMLLTAGTPSIRERVETSVAISKAGQKILAQGFYNPPTYRPAKPPQKNKELHAGKNYFDFDVTIDNFPMDFFEYLLKPSIKETVGTLDVDGRLFGSPSRVEINGLGIAKDVETTITFLNTRFNAPTARINLTNKLFDASETIVFDEEGNQARVLGGITHNHLKNLGLDVRIATLGDKFVALNTSEEHNSYFYGKGVGTGYAQFNGSFKQPDAYISATAAPGTKVVIPISYSQEASELTFIEFPDKKKTDKVVGEKGTPEIRGMDIQMDFVLNEYADIELIFDKYWGDLIRGTGDGNLKIKMTRDGGFTMDGEYVVQQGNYLFTLMTIVNKPFAVERGGTIVWDGDPYNAELNLSAVYEGLEISVANLIQEYLVTATSDVQQLARNTTDVDLKMLLTGQLLSPTINFDIDFPELSSELKNYTDNKLRVIRQDQNELNRQVFGLLVFNQFLPTDFNVNTADLGINTLSEMISNQFSMYISEFFTELLSPGGIISNIDFDVNYRQGQYVALDDPSNLETQNELSGRLKLSLGPNNKWQVTVGVGGQVGQTQVTDNQIISQEVLVEYTLTKDRRLKLKAYNKFEPDIASGRRRKTGVGLSFSKEFNSLSELFESKKKRKEKNKKKGND